MKKMIYDSVVRELGLGVDIMNPQIKFLVNSFVTDRLETIVNDLTYLCEEGKFVELRDEVSEIREHEYVRMKKTGNMYTKDINGVQYFVFVSTHDDVESLTVFDLSMTMLDYNENLEIYDVLQTHFESDILGLEWKGINQL